MTMTPEEKRQAVIDFINQESEKADRDANRENEIHELYMELAEAITEQSEMPWNAGFYEGIIFAFTNHENVEAIRNYVQLLRMGV